MWIYFEYLCLYRVSFTCLLFFLVLLFLLFWFGDVSWENNLRIPCIFFTERKVDWMRRNSCVVVFQVFFFIYKTSVWCTHTKAYYFTLQWKSGSRSIWASFLRQNEMKKKKMMMMMSTTTMVTVWSSPCAASFSVWKWKYKYYAYNKTHTSKWYNKMRKRLFLRRKLHFDIERKRREVTVWGREGNEKIIQRKKSRKGNT